MCVCVWFVALVDRCAVSAAVVSEPVITQCQCNAAMLTSAAAAADVTSAADTAAVSAVSLLGRHGDMFNTGDIDVTLYPSLHRIDAPQHCVLNTGAGQIQHFVAVVDVLRMSSVGPSLLPTQPAGVMATVYRDRTLHQTDRRTHVADTGSTASGVLGTDCCTTPQPADVSGHSALMMMPCCSVNALFTFPTHLSLPAAATQPLIGYDGVAGQRVIGCEYCDSPMTGVVCP